MEEKKKNIPLIVALSIPVLMIALIAVSIYLPAMLIKPKFNFVYSVGGDYCYQNRYSVKSGKIIENEIKKPEENNSCRNYREARLFYYDVERNTSREITLDEATKLTVDDSLKSPDGFEIVSGSYSFDIFFFSGSSYYDKYLKKGAYNRKLNITGPTSYYDFRFIGWLRGKNHG